MENNVINIRALMTNSSDLTIKYAKAAGVNICIIFCEGMVSTSTMADLIFRPINRLSQNKELDYEQTVRLLRDGLLLAGEQKSAETYGDLALMIMSGFVALVIEGQKEAIMIGVQGYSARSVEEPSTHLNVRAARDSFVETIRTNVSLIRRRMKTTDLVFKMIKVGGLSQTDVCICYIKGRADPKLVAQVEKRLSDIKLDAPLESGYLQPFLDERGDSIFSEVGATERPDSLTAKIYGGRIGILIDGSPFALFVPQLFTENFIAMDDYTGRPAYAALIRVFRYIAYFTSIMLAGFYVALASFNPELFPDALLLNLSASVQDTPYPLLTECLLIHIFFEMMREAGLRIPSNIGHAVSIVGGLVIGEIVVSAGLVGAPLVLIVALSAICSFVVPDLYESITVMRFCYIIVGGMWGLFGLTALTVVFLLKICSMNAYGIPATAPVSPFTFKSMRDVILRIGWRKMPKSDVTIQQLNGVRINEKD